MGMVRRAGDNDGRRAAVVHWCGHGGRIVMLGRNSRVIPASVSSVRGGGDCDAPGNAVVASASAKHGVLWRKVVRESVRKERYSMQKCEVVAMSRCALKRASCGRS